MEHFARMRNTKIRLCDGKPENSGFTLVELAIVMTIVGILIGGLLKGEEFINLARAKAQIKQLLEVDAATRAFIDKYHQWPGDMSTARARLPGCISDNGAGNWCNNGNGNSRIGRDDAAMFGSNYNQNQQNPWFPDQETLQYWKHLALAELITGVNPGADYNDPQWGVTNPEAKFRGGLTVNYSLEGSQIRVGHYIRIQAPVKGPLPDRKGEQPLPIKWARYIDLKLDDGKPESGMVNAESTNSRCDTHGGTTSEWWYMSPAAQAGERVSANDYNCDLWYFLNP